jgi:predicted ATPase/DNA-binding CsgD family transcriptional regulator
MKDSILTPKDGVIRNKTTFTNIPSVRTSLIGRDKELKIIHDLLLREDINLLTLTGLGGTGKTSLALQVASSLLSSFPDGVFFVGLASLTKSETILIEIARILKVEQGAHKNILEGLKDFLSGRRILLILDNFEHLMEGASQVSDLLQTSTHLKIIVTSRESLHLQVEQTFQVPPLSSEYAIELFTKRAQSLNPDFSMSQQDTRSVTELCQRLDGLPLAIELAALRTKSFTPQAMLDRLKPDLKPATPILDLLSLGARDLPKRQQSLRNTIAWSYGLLDVEEQKVFRFASIFPAGFSIQILSALLKQNENNVLEIISSLVDKSLIKPSLEKHYEPRFILLDAIREYAWDEILRLGELESLKDAYVDIYSVLSEQANDGLKGKNQSEWFNRLDDEIMNVTLVLEICLTSKQGSSRWRRGYPILHRLHRYWMLREHFRLVSQYITRARESIEEYINGNPADNKEVSSLKAMIYSLSGSMAWVTGNYRQASDWHEVAYLNYKDLADDHGMAEALNNWGVNLGLLGEYEEALKKHENALVLSRKNGDRSSEMWQLDSIGNILGHFGRLEAALLSFEEGLKIARELNDVYFIGSLMHNIAHLKLRAGDYDAAVSLSHSSLEIASQIQIPYIQVWSLAILGMGRILQGDVENARKAALESSSLADKISETALRMELLRLFICVLFTLGRTHEAVQIFATLEKIRSETDYQENPFNILYSHGMIEKVRSLFSSDVYRMHQIGGAKMTFDAAITFAANVLQESVDVIPALLETSNLSFLTIREQEVLILIAQGFTNEQISKELVVVVKTVEKHVANVLMKLGLKNRTEAAAWAIENEFLNVDTRKK